MQSMTLAFVRDKIIRTTFAEVLPGKFDSPEAEVMLLAIGQQESRFETRQQYGGPARSFWQMEKHGGVENVIESESTAAYARMACAHRRVRPTVDSVFAVLGDDDLLGCAFARLDLYANPHPLPALGSPNAAWDYYIATWRPGKPHPATWAANYARALAAVRAA